MLKIKFIITSALCLFALNISAQNEVDAIRYSQQTIGSTARSFGIGGAFGAVGGDPSCAAINPSGLARFRSSKFFISTGFYNAKSKTTFIDQTYDDKKFNFNIPNISLIANIPGEDFTSKNPTGFVNFVFALNVNRLNNFHKRSILDANNPLNSITENWAERANDGGLIPSQLSKYSLEYLAYNAYVIDPDVSSSKPKYYSAYNGSPIKVNQSGAIVSRGALNDYNMSLAANYRHLIQGGISIGFKSVRYIEDNSFTETDLKVSTVKDIKSVNLEQYLKTTGVGFNAKVGFTYQPTEFLRIGYAYHSPSQLNLKDSYSYTINSVFDYGARSPDSLNRENSSKSTNSTGYKYRITTPGRNVFSIALVNKTLGFLSLDIETVNYGSARLFATDYAFKTENRNLAKNYSNVVNLRFGAEAIYEQFRFRAGYARYPSPYKTNFVPYVNSLVNNVYTLGFGIKSDTYSLDFAYVNSGYADYTVPYTLASPNTYFTATNNVRTTNFLITAGFNID